MLFALAARAYPDAISQISKSVDRRNTVESDTREFKAASRGARAFGVTRTHIISS